MEENFPHLSIQRESPINEKRPGNYMPPRPPSDVRGHGRGLLGKLNGAKAQASENLGGFDDRKLFRFSVEKGFDPDDLRKISPEIEFVSQEDETVVIGFASDAALAQFEARLSTMAGGGDVTNKQVIYALHSVDGWNDENRKGWALINQGFPESEQFLLDVELWPLEDNSQARDQESVKFEQWLDQQEIQRKDQVKRQELTLYRVRCNANQADLLLKHRDVRSVDLLPSFGLERSVIFQDVQDFPEAAHPGELAPGVVVLDSGIASGHPLLKSSVEESKSFLPGEGADDENGHGTHVAGLALYGDFETGLRNRYFVPTLRLFSGRILNKENENSTGFVENHIEEAVRHFSKEHGCRVFNLSFGDANKPYHGGHLKGLSVTLDNLSREMGVLFIVSAGNHRIGEDSPDGLAWRDNYPHYLSGDAWRIIEPAPALNALTVGSLARHNQTYNSQTHTHDPAEIPIAQPDQPSPFTRGGYSVGGAIKPELVAHGGNWAINTRAGHALMDRGAGLGVVSTSHQFVSGNPFIADAGTSMAAPQVAHLAASVLREYPEATANFIRAQLCLNAAYPKSSQELIEDSKFLRRLCGYGRIDETSLHRSLESAVTLVSDGSIEDKRHHFYEIPIPAEFTSGGRKRIREIAVSLAYTPPVRSTRIKYRATRIDFRLVAARDLEHVTTMFNKVTKKEDYQNIKELTGATVGQVARSKGTVQADLWRFKTFNSRSLLRTKKLFVVVTRNDFPWGESLCDNEENYSLLVSLRDKEYQESQLYTKIKAHLEAKVSVRVRT
ncbi:S8 family peptidase [Alcanivorax jadensis]|uniref:S8 family peptidase n=1 Tax=Alcanivorax jadensis TaxID=64988 RepID=UPI0026EF67D7|nr:S8 family peptidase [Alcanivorax jadensis]